MRTLKSLLAIMMKDKETPKNIASLRITLIYGGTHGKAHVRAHFIYTHFN